MHLHRGECNTMQLPWADMFPRVRTLVFLFLLPHEHVETNIFFYMNDILLHAKYLMKPWWFRVWAQLHTSTQSATPISLSLGGFMGNPSFCTNDVLFSFGWLIPLKILNCWYFGMSYGSLHLRFQRGFGKLHDRFGCVTQFYSLLVLDNKKCMSMPDQFYCHVEALVFFSLDYKSVLCG